MKKSPPTWLKEIKLIAWDLDGTLYPPMPEITEEIDAARAVAIAKHLGVTETEAKAKFQPLYDRLHSTTRVFNELGMEGEQFFIDFWASFDLSQYIKPDPQLKKMFAVVRMAGRQHALLTNANTSQSVQSKLTAIGLTPDDFSAIFASGLTGIHKPTPAAFAQLWEQTEFAKEQIVYLGDKENTDIIPAKKLGLKTMLMDWSNQASVTSADGVVSSPREFLGLLASGFD
ncbi:MAG TPA: HAD family hydrolase [Patescibacteria group bacterium]|jgi:FMN phosphatase YigB (HAD superfamily)